MLYLSTAAITFIVGYWCGWCDGQRREK